MTAHGEKPAAHIFDSQAPSYGMDFRVNYTQHLKYLLLEKFAKAGDACLDVGIANGILSIPLSAKVGAVHGVDISPKMLEMLRSELERRGIRNVVVHERSATDLGFDDATFDLAYCYSTLLLLKDPAAALREMFRVLKPGGAAIVDIAGALNLSWIYWSAYYRRRGHFGLTPYTLPRIRRVLADTGFEILETHATGLLDQWKYVPLANRVLHKLGFPEKIAHRTPDEPDLDYRVSQIFPPLANRWYFVLRKP